MSAQPNNTSSQPNNSSSSSATRSANVSVTNATATYLPSSSLDPVVVSKLSNEGIATIVIVGLVCIVTVIVYLIIQNRKKGRRRPVAKTSPVAIPRSTPRPSSVHNIPLPPVTTTPPPVTVTDRPRTLDHSERHRIHRTRSAPLEPGRRRLIQPLPGSAHDRASSPFNAAVSDASVDSLSDARSLRRGADLGYAPRAQGRFGNRGGSTISHVSHQPHQFEIDIDFVATNRMAFRERARVSTSGPRAIEPTYDLRHHLSLKRSTSAGQWNVYHWQKRDAV